MSREKSIGLLLISGAMGVFIPYTILTFIFEYPDILREDTATILTKFHQGGSMLIITWWTFAMLGTPLLIASIQIGNKLSAKLGFVRWVTMFGVTGLIVQQIGLLRWVFVVPVLADNFVAGNEMTKQACKVAFQVVHQYGGVVLGEHLGQLFTIFWTVGMSYAFRKLKLFPDWINWLGFVSSFIYFFAQTELFATVIPGVPVFDIAGFAGSTLWLLWLLIVGIVFMRNHNADDQSANK
jgi:hypothetical protein